MEASVFTGDLTAVIGQRISEFVIVEGFSCTNCIEPPIAAFAIVGTIDKVKKYSKEYHVMAVNEYGLPHVISKKAENNL